MTIIQRAGTWSMMNNIDPHGDHIYNQSKIAKFSTDFGMCPPAPLICFRRIRQPYFLDGVSAIYFPGDGGREAKGQQDWVDLLL
jgi:hypothetical protein